METLTWKLPSRTYWELRILDDRELLNRALDGDEECVRMLVDRLTPIIQRRVAYALLGVGTPTSRIRQEVSDITQEILCDLLAGPRILENWMPELGLDLDNFVNMVARRRTLSRLRSKKLDPRQESPTPTEELDGTSRTPSPERKILAQEKLDWTLDRLSEELSPLGYHLFDLLFLKQQDPQEVARSTGLTIGNIYTWRSRLRRLIENLLAEWKSRHE